METIIIIIFLFIFLVVCIIFISLLFRGNTITGSAEKTSSGNKSIKEFLASESIKDIQDNIFDFISKSDICDVQLGQGMMGSVYQRKIGDTYPLTLNNKIVDFPIIIKFSNDNSGTEFTSKIIDNKLYIYSFLDMSAEALMLSIVRDMWMSELCPHVPLMLDYSACNANKVTRICTERQGLSKPITIKIPWLNETQMWRKVDKLNTSYDTTLATLYDLAEYICIYRNDNIIKLPNNIEVPIDKLIDQFTISYLFTHDLLARHGLYLQDMHSKNIFIHWLNTESYLGNKHIADIKKIRYKINNKIFEIETYGILLKVGDIGASIYKPRDNVYLLGQCGNIDLSAPILNQIVTPQHSCWFFIENMLSLFPHSIISNTISHKIMTSAPYKEWNKSGFDLTKLLTPIKLLNQFDSFVIKEDNKADNILVI